jgi:hypothetical protein
MRKPSKVNPSEAATRRDETALKILSDAELEQAVGAAVSPAAMADCACACGETACAGSGSSAADA